MATIYIEEHVFNGAQALTELKLSIVLLTESKRRY